MSELDRLVNACLLPGLSAGSAPDWAHEGLRAGLAGFVLFPPQDDFPPERAGQDDFPSEQPGQGGPIAVSTRALRSTAPDALLAIDEEGGDVTRLEYGGGSSYPGALALGVVDDLAVTAQVAAAIAGDLRAAGINLNLAPSVDVNSDPDNPIIGVRSFGANPGRVAAHGTAFIRALQDAGVAACAKHFPGHGATVTDSHRDVAVVDCDLETFHRRELAPFAAAVGAGVRTVMAAQVLFPALDPVRPANLSRALLHDLLRVELGYQGVVIGTAIALLGPVPPEELTRTAIESLRAGADLLLLGAGDGERLCAQLRAGLTAAVRGGELDLATLERAAGWVAALRRSADPAASVGRGTAPDRSVGLAAARRAVRAEGEVTLSGPATVVELRASGNSVVGEAHWGLAEPLAEFGRLAELIRADENAGSAEQILAKAGANPLVLVVRDAYREPARRALVADLLGARPDAILVAVGMPDDLRLTRGPSIGTYGAGAVNLRAAAELLAGTGMGE